MSLRLTAWARSASIVCVLCGYARVARAHAPQARAAALTADAARAAVVMPGFGVLMRTHASAPFEYVCDALLDDQPTDHPAAVAFLADGSLLLGSMNGARVIAPNGCPPAAFTSELGSAAVFALAAHSGAAEVVYAVATAGDEAGVWRSDDSGKSWTLRSALDGAELVTALLVDDADPNQIYVSKSTTDGHSSLLVSMDGGATFAAFAQDRALTLLHLPIAVGKPYWAMTRALDNTTNRGFDIQRADTLAGPFTTALRVNYFGGFAIEPAGTIWVGDEGGGVYRSADGGDTFKNVAPDAATACLIYAGGALWSCTPGTNQQPALSKFEEASTTFSGIVAFADVTQQVDCPPEVDVRRRCALAWVEWQRDVLMIGSSLPDAGVSSPSGAGTADAAAQDASAPASGDADAAAADAAAQDAGATASVDAGVANAGHLAQPRRVAHSGCSIGEQSKSQRGAWSALVPLLLVLRSRRRRTTIAGMIARCAHPRARQLSRSRDRRRVDANDNRALG